MLISLIAPTLQTDLRIEAAPFHLHVGRFPLRWGPLPDSHAGMYSLRTLEAQRTERYYTKLQQGPNLVLRELGLDHVETFGEPDAPPLMPSCAPPAKFSRALRAWDCVELFAGFGNWSKAHSSRGLRVHPGIERGALGRGYRGQQHFSSFGEGGCFRCSA